MLVEENFHPVFDIEIKQCTYNNKAMINDGKVASGWRNYVTELPKSKTAPSGLVFTPTARQWAAFQFIAVANGSHSESEFVSLKTGRYLHKASATISCTIRLKFAD